MQKNPGIVVERAKSNRRARGKEDIVKAMGYLVITSSSCEEWSKSGAAESLHFRRATSVAPPDARLVWSWK